jgi:hypothetical protein
MSSRRLLIVISLLVMILAACAPAATPTPTPEPTVELPTPTPTDPADAPEVSPPEGVDLTGEGFPGAVGSSSIRIRTIPASSGEVIAELPRDTRLIAFAQTPDFGYLYVRTEDGAVEGWTSKQTITLDDRFASIPTGRPADS